MNSVLDSSNWWKIAKALSRNARLLVLDEPTAALTESEVDILRQILMQLREKGVACIYITHKLKEIFQIADRVTVLRDGKSVATQSIDECTEAVLISQMVGRELTARFPSRAHHSSLPEGGNVALRVEKSKHLSFGAHRVLKRLTSKCGAEKSLGSPG